MRELQRNAQCEAMDKSLWAENGILFAWRLFVNNIGAAEASNSKRSVAHLLNFSFGFLIAKNENQCDAKRNDRHHFIELAINASLWCIRHPIHHHHFPQKKHTKKKRKRDKER